MDGSRTTEVSVPLRSAPRRPSTGRGERTQPPRLVRHGAAARTALLGTALLLLAGPQPADARQGSFPGAAPPSGDPGFLFDRPSVSLGVRGGMFLHRAESDLYDFSTERFTLERSDFRALALAVEGGVWLGNRGELTVAIDGSRLTLRSEYRDWAEEVERPDGTFHEIPIRQSTRFSHGPAFAVGLRWYLRDRGERLGQFIWIPAQWNAYVGAGGGVTAYRYRLEGDFVDEAQEIVLTDRYESRGTTPFPFVNGGVEIGLTTRTAASFEGRYQWGEHDLGPHFARDFTHPLDLAGLRLSAGVHVRF